MTLLGDAIMAKKRSCPRCGSNPGTSCVEPDRQYVPLLFTHHERLSLIGDGWNEETVEVARADG